MTLPNPTHYVRVRHLTTRVVHVYQCFSQAYAEALLQAYEAHGWTGTIEARR